MEHDTIDLIRTLLCRVGMALEDVCGLAVAPPRDPVELAAVIDTLWESLERSINLVRAAKSLGIDDS